MLPGYNVPTRTSSYKKDKSNIVSVPKKDNSHDFFNSETAVRYSACVHAKWRLASPMGERWPSRLPVGRPPF